LVIDDLTSTITNIATTTTTTGGTTTTGAGTTTTQQLRTTTTTDPGGTTTTTLVLGANLPNTGGGQLIPILLSGFGLMLLGAGLILLAPRRYPRWVV
jgi:LPXTG-motif cell wall-anchored protein